MTFVRKLHTDISPQDLDQQIAGIGIRIDAKPDYSANIEDTLFAASIEGIKQDYRLLSLLVDWIDIHLPRVNADRMIKLINEYDDELLINFWTALAQWKKTDHRFARLRKKIPKKRFEILPSDFNIEKYGEDPRFKDTILRVSSNFLRHRPSDVMTPRELAKKHRAYHWRVVIGPTYRADLWALFEKDSAQSVAEVARSAHCAFATAWNARRDWGVLSKSNDSPPHTK